MKKVCISFALLTIIILTIAAFGIPTGTPEYLRIHIRANSNGEVDQAVKYRVKTAVVDYLTPCIAECDTKQKARAAPEESQGRGDGAGEKTPIRH